VPLQKTDMLGIMTKEKLNQVQQKQRETKFVRENIFSSFWALWWLGVQILSIQETVFHKVSLSQILLHAVKEGHQISEQDLPDRLQCVQLRGGLLVQVCRHNST